MSAKVPLILDPNGKPARVVFPPDTYEPSALLLARQEILTLRQEVARLKATLEALSVVPTKRREGRPSTVITVERIRAALHRARPAATATEKRYVDDLFSHMEDPRPYAELGERWGVGTSGAFSRIERALLWAEGKRR